MQSGATTVGKTEGASGPCHIRSAAFPASASEFPRASHADQQLARGHTYRRTIVVMQGIGTLKIRPYRPAR
jgi:hypothetical protein